MNPLDSITLPLVLVTAGIDSINPCAIGVLVFLISCLLSLSHDRRKMLALGFIYIGAVFVTYFLAGLGLIWFVQQWNLVTEVSIVVASLVIILGLIELKDFFWYERGATLTIAPKYIARIKKISRHATIPGLIVLGFFVAAVELPCTGGPYLAITAYLAKNPLSLQGLAYLALYNFIFVLPLIVIVLAVYFGTKIAAIKSWKEGGKRWMRLAAGLVMIGLGILLILYSQGAISI